MQDVVIHLQRSTNDPFQDRPKVVPVLPFLLPRTRLSASLRSLSMSVYDVINWKFGAIQFNTTYTASVIRFSAGACRVITVDSVLTILNVLI